MNVGQALKKIRENKNVSLDTLSKTTGISVQTLTDIEEGKMTPSKDAIRVLGEGLEVSKEVLMFFSICEGDIHESKRQLFKALSGPIEKLLSELITPYYPVGQYEMRVKDENTVLVKMLGTDEEGQPLEGDNLESQLHKIAYELSEFKKRKLETNP